jgi:hypothetical protein
VSWAFDPPTGRRLVQGGGDVTSWVEAWAANDDSRAEFHVNLPGNGYGQWAGDGSVLVSYANDPDAPAQVTVASIDRDGELGPPLIQAVVDSGGVIGVRDGFAVVLLENGMGRRGPTTGEPGALFVILRLTDGATSTLRFDSAFSLQWAGILPP